LAKLPVRQFFLYPARIVLWLSVILRREAIGKELRAGGREN